MLLCIISVSSIFSDKENICFSVFDSKFSALVIIWSFILSSSRFRISLTKIFWLAVCLLTLFFIILNLVSISNFSITPFSLDIIMMYFWSLNIFFLLIMNSDSTMTFASSFIRFSFIFWCTLSKISMITLMIKFSRTMQIINVLNSQRAYTKAVDEFELKLLRSYTPIASL